MLRVRFEPFITKYCVVKMENSVTVDSRDNVVISAVTP